MKKLIPIITIIMMIIFSNTMIVSMTIATTSSFEKINIHKRQSPPDEPQPGPSWRNDNLIPLCDAIKKKYLGTLPNLRSETILGFLRTLNPNIINTDNLYVSNITYEGAIINSIPSPTSQYSGSTMVYFGNEETNKLSNIIVNRDLGQITDFTQEGIIQLTKKLNPTIDINQLYADNIKQNSATIKPLPNSWKYRGSTSVIFKKEGIISLTGLLLTRHLSNIPDYNPRTILTRLQALNPEININELSVENITTNGAKIKVLPNSKIYRPNDYLYIQYNMPFLSSLIINTYLGGLENNSATSIQHHLQILNPGILVNSLRVINITANSAEIVPITGSTLYTGNVTVTFFVEERHFFLRNVIRNPNLILSEDNADETIILKNIQKNNPEIDISELVVTEIQPNKHAIINAKPKSRLYRGELMVQITNRKIVPLSSAVKTTFLKKIPDNNPGTILHYFQAANPNIILTEVYVAAITSNSAVIMATSGSTFYKEKVKITFSLWSLNNILINRHLGEIPENSPTEILTRLQTLNHEININELSVENITENSAEISTQEFPLHFHLEQKISVNFKTKRKVSILSKIINWTVLGDLLNNSEELILVRLQELNPNLDINQIYIINITENSAIIRPRPNSNELIGEVTIYFTSRRQLLDINNIMLNNYLGQIENFLPQTILTRLQALNPEINRNHFSITNISQNSAIVRPDASLNIYQGTIRIYFNVNPNIHALENIITNNNLGQIPNFYPETILNRLQELYPNLDRHQLFVHNISNTSAEIFSRTDSNVYTGQITVYFDLIHIFYLLNDIITNQNLGEIPENSPAAILTRLQALNPEININELSAQNITENSAEIVPITDSTLYNGQVTVYFNLGSTRDLSFEFINTYLGELSTPNSPTIYSTISELNPNLDINQLDIINLTINSAIIKPSPFSIYKNEVQIKFETHNYTIKSDYPTKFEDTIFDKIKFLNLTLSKQIFRKITYIFFKHEQITAIDKIKKILEKTTKTQDKKDLAILATLIWNHFSYYYELYNTLSENQSVLIKTNTEGYWDNADPWKYNTVLGNDKEFKNKNFSSKALNNIDIYNEKKETECLKASSDSYNVLEGYYGSWFKLKIKFETLLYIKLLFYTNNKETFINKLSELLYSFPQTLNSTFKSYDIAKSDIYNTAYMIWQHFSYYQNLIFWMNKGQALIIDNKSNIKHGYWDNDDPWKYNTVIGEQITTIIKHHDSNSSLYNLNKKNINFDRKTFYIDHQNKIYTLYPILLQLKQKIINNESMTCNYKFNT